MIRIVPRLVVFASPIWGSTVESSIIQNPSACVVADPKLMNTIKSKTIKTRQQFFRFKKNFSAANRGFWFLQTFYGADRLPADARRLKCRAHSPRVFRRIRLLHFILLIPELKSSLKDRTTFHLASNSCMTHRIHGLFHLRSAVANCRKKVANKYHGQPEVVAARAFSEPGFRKAGFQHSKSSSTGLLNSPVGAEIVSTIGTPAGCPSVP
jgi:hypothetical protein